MSLLLVCRPFIWLVSDSPSSLFSRVDPSIRTGIAKTPERRRSEDSFVPSEVLIFMRTVLQDLKA